MSKGDLREDKVNFQRGGVQIRSRGYLKRRLTVVLSAKIYNREENTQSVSHGLVAILH